MRSRAGPTCSASGSARPASFTASPSWTSSAAPPSTTMTVTASGPVCTADAPTSPFGGKEARRWATAWSMSSAVPSSKRRVLADARMTSCSVSVLGAADPRSTPPTRQEAHGTHSRARGVWASGLVQGIRTLSSACEWDMASLPHPVSDMQIVPKQGICATSPSASRTRSQARARGTGYTAWAPTRGPDFRSQEAVERTGRVSDTLRREEVYVNEDAALLDESEGTAVQRGLDASHNFLISAPWWSATVTGARSFVRSHPERGSPASPDDRAWFHGCLDMRRRAGEERARGRTLCLTNTWTRTVPQTTSRTF